MCQALRLPNFHIPTRAFKGGGNITLNRKRFGFSIPVVTVVYPATGRIIFHLMIMLVRARRPITPPCRAGETFTIIVCFGQPPQQSSPPGANIFDDRAFLQICRGGGGSRASTAFCRGLQGRFRYFSTCGRAPRAAASTETPRTPLVAST